MRKLQIIIPLLLLLAGMPFAGFTQKALVEVIDHYYLHNPFTGRFSTFLKNMMNDPRLTKKIIHKRTDSTLFYLKAEYISPAPFSFKPVRVEVIVAESEIQLSDSDTNPDTILVYQLIGYTAYDLQAMKKEFDRFDKKYGRRFANSNFSDIMNKDQQEGSIHNYFLTVSPVSPLSISWGKINNTETAYIVTVRLVSRENEAMLPYIPDTDSH